MYQALKPIYLHVLYRVSLVIKGNMVMVEGKYYTIRSEILGIECSSSAIATRRAEVANHCRYGLKEDN